MARNENPPFLRGETWFGTKGETPTLTEALNLIGKVWMFEDIKLNAPFTTTGSVKPNRTNRYVKCMLVRNSSGGNLTRALLAKLDITAPDMFGQVSGLATAVGDLAYPIDEYLSQVVPANDIFWVVVEGPATVTTGASGDTNFAAGALLSPTTGGKVVQLDPAAVTQDLVDAIWRSPGYSSVAVNAINTEFVMNVISRGIAG